MIVYILIVSFILRFVLLNQSFWLDEGISAITAAKPFPFQWTGIYGDFQPPLYYLILRLYMYIPYWSEWFLRLPSVFFGVATVGVLYLFTKEKFGGRIALISSLLLSISQFHIYYSQELRMYSLLGLLALLSMWLFSRQKWILLAIVSILGIYTNYMFFLTFVPQFIWLFYKYRNDGKIWKKWGLFILVVLLCFIPWCQNFSKQILSGRNLTEAFPSWSNISSPPFWRLIPQIFLKFTMGRISLDNKYVYGGIFFSLFAFFVYIFWNLKKTRNDNVNYVINWLVSPLISGIFISFFMPIAGVWRLIFLLPPFLLLVAVSIVKMKYFKLVFGILIALSLMSVVIYWFIPKYQREQWRQAVSFIEMTDDPVIFVTEDGFAPYTWYRKKDKLVCGQATNEECLKSKNVYFVSYLEDLFDQKKTIENRIKKSNFHVSDVKDFPGVGFVYHYENSN
jgi:uncharacterized membrane protein